MMRITMQAWFLDNLWYNGSACERLAPHRPGGHDRVEVVELREDPRAALVKEGVDGLLDDADGVVWPPMEVGANLGEDVLRHIVERVAREHVCMALPA